MLTNTIFLNLTSMLQFGKNWVLFLALSYYMNTAKDDTYLNNFSFSHLECWRIQ